MENLKNFIGSVTGNSGNMNAANRSPYNKSVPKTNSTAHDTMLGYGMKPASNTIRNRTDSECSTASTSSIENASPFNRQNSSQKDKDSYFWVM